MTAKKIIFSLITILLLAPSPASAELLVVPDDFEIIQDAIDATQSGDTVWILPGRYTEVSLLIPDHDLTLTGSYLFTGDTLDIEGTTLFTTSDLRRQSLTAPAGDGIQDVLRVIGLNFDARLNYGGGFHVLAREFDMRACRLDSVSTANVIRNSVVHLQDTRFRHMPLHENWGVTFLMLWDCKILIERCTFFDSITDMQYPSEIFIHRGTIEIRDSHFHQMGRPENEGMTAVVYAQDTVSEITMVGNVFENIWLWHLHRHPSNLRMTIRFDSNLVRNCGVFGGGVAIYTSDLGPESMVQMNDNVFMDNTDIPNVGGDGFFQFGSDSSHTIEMKRNLFLRNVGRRYSCGVISGSEEERDISFNYFIENAEEPFSRPESAAALSIQGNDSAEFYHSIIHGNAGVAVKHFAPNLYGPGYLRDCYWGHESGPYHPSNNPFGQGDTVDTLIVFEPWEADTSFLETAVDPPPHVPTDFLIGRAWPNPFNSSITIEYVVTGTHDVRLDIFDVLGRHVETLVDERQSVAIHRAIWQPEGTASGIYFARLTTSGSPQKPWLHKLVYLK